jgi:hypothetical protein
MGTSDAVVGVQTTFMLHERHAIVVFVWHSAAECRTTVASLPHLQRNTDNSMSWIKKRKE